ncbi:MAG: ROK family protein [Patescibacteria group bacterium]
MYISIDIGKSNTRVASTKDLVSIHKIIKFSTDQDLEEQKKLMIDAVYGVRDNQDIKAIVLGVTGINDKTNKKFIKSPNFPALNGLNFNSLLPEVLRRIPFYVENDAALGALGEAYFGSGKEKTDVAYLTLSSGVGGALILKEKEGFKLISSEPGHHVICESDTLVDKSGLSGTFESYCSGSMFETRYGVKPKGDIDKEIWKKYAKHLSTGIINITAMWRPEIVVLGGGMSNYNFDLFYPYLNEELKKQTFFNIPEIKKSLLEDDSGVYGGFVLLSKTL